MTIDWDGLCVGQIVYHKSAVNINIPWDVYIERSRNLIVFFVHTKKLYISLLNWTNIQI